MKDIKQMIRGRKNLFNFTGTTTRVIAAAAAALLAGAAIMFVMHNNANKAANNVNGNVTQPGETSGGELGIYGDILKDPHDPLIPDAFYKGTVTIIEKDLFDTSGQAYASGFVDSTLISEEILFYDNRTDKCYILGRRVSYEGKGTVKVTHSGGAFSGTAEIDSGGAVTELYGHLIKDNGKYLDYSALPLRIDVKGSNIFTVAPTERPDWVITLIGTDVSYGPPTVSPPEELSFVDFGLIPGKKQISVTKTFSNTESYLDELSGELIKPSGTFTCEYNQIDESEYMALIVEFSAEIKQSEEAGQTEFIPDLPPLPDDDSDASVDNVNGVELPQDYPQDVLPISDDAFIAVVETIDNEDNNGSGYAITLKVDQDIEDTTQSYMGMLNGAKNTSSYIIEGVSTLSGEKNGYEFSIMIMDNTLGGTERTMVQIMLNPVGD